MARGEVEDKKYICEYEQECSHSGHGDLREQGWNGAGKATLAEKFRTRPLQHACGEAPPENDGFHNITCIEAFCSFVAIQTIWLA